MRSSRPIGGVLGLAALAGALVAPGDAASQVKASERASLSQTVDGTVITVEYSRPQARGRAPLFGEVVPWGRAWTGANDNTVLDVSRDVRVEGVAVPAGRWGVWLVPAEDGPWELVLDPRDSLWHTVHPGPTDDQIRVPVEALRQDGEDDPVEVLTWAVPAVTPTGARLVMSWGAWQVPLEVTVESSVGDPALPPGEAEPLVGDWAMRWEGVSGDADPVPFTVRHDDAGALRAEVDLGATDGMLLVPLARGVFRPVMTEDGEPREALANYVIEFEYGDGRAVAFAFRDGDDAVIARGVRAGEG